MKRLIAMCLFVAAMTVPTAGSAFADDPHGVNGSPATGQPSQSCQNTTPPAFPGNTGNSPGSAFNGTANGIYANPNTQGGISSGNPKVVAQYDVACFQQASH
jgi:hypothetical protein